jgi:hypothetical protein
MAGDFKLMVVGLLEESGDEEPEEEEGCVDALRNTSNVVPAVSPAIAETRATLRAREGDLIEDADGVPDGLLIVLASEDITSINSLSEKLLNFEEKLGSVRIMQEFFFCLLLCDKCKLVLEDNNSTASLFPPK